MQNTFITQTRSPVCKSGASLKLAISCLALVLARTLPAAQTQPQADDFKLRLAMSFSPPAAHVDEPEHAPLLAEFNPVFFSAGGKQTVDLSRYRHGNPITPGTFRYAVRLNGAWVGKHDIVISPGEDGGAPEICHTPAMVQLWGVDPAKLPQPAVARTSLAEDRCFDALRLVPGFSAHIDTTEFVLEIAVPQAYLNSRLHRGYVDSSQWTNGVTAGFVNYNVGAFKTDQDGSRIFGAFNSGLNLGDWRLRHNGTLNWNHRQVGGSTPSFKSVSAYAQRDITSLNAQLVAGQYFTRSFLFDSLPYTGIELSSDDRMLPETQRGFAPIVRGVAESNARVSIRQGDRVVYEAVVPPGAFAIDDLFNTGFAGDLAVTITESDGRVKNFTVPYATVAQMLRPGQSRYSVVAGEYREEGMSDPPLFLQATYQYGWSNLLTAYTGGIVASDYHAVQAGLAFSTPIGALATDATYSRARGVFSGNATHRQDVDGYSYRLTYSRLFDMTGTYLSLAGYRFSSDGYLDLADFARTRDSQHQSAGMNFWRPARQRNRLQLTVNQPLGERGGSLYLSGTSEDYWGGDGKRVTTFQAGHSSNYRWGSLNFGASRTRAYSGSYDTIYQVSISLPLSRSLGAPRVNSTLTYRDAGNVGHQMSLGGSVGEDGALGYGAYVNTDRYDGHTETAVGGNLQYRAPNVQLSASAGGTSSSWQASAGASGSVVVHPGGVNFSASRGETMAVLKADGAAGATINGRASDRIGSNGYGLVTGLTPYRLNEVAIDPKGSSEDVEIHGTAQQVAPRFGAIVMLTYETEQGEMRLLALQRDDGKPVPFGARVLDGSGKAIGVVGQGGRALLRGAVDADSLQVSWGDGADDGCRVDYSRPQAPASGEASVAAAVCILPLGSSTFAARNQ